MDRIERTLFDKSKWPDGPWKNEVDYIEWTIIQNKYYALILRNGYCRETTNGSILCVGGNLCGYIGIPSSHPAYKKHYEDLNIKCHGGLTFAGFLPYQKEEIWYLGFDCAHYNDCIPSMLFEWPEHPEFKNSLQKLYPVKNYKTIEFVEKEINNIYSQLKDMETAPD